MNGASCWGLAGFSPLPPRPLQVYTTKTAAEISFSLDDYGGGPVTSKKMLRKRKLVFFFFHRASGGKMRQRLIGRNDEKVSET